MKRAIAVKTVRCCTVRGTMGLRMEGNTLAMGLRGLRRFIFK